MKQTNLDMKLQCGGNVHIKNTSVNDKESRHDG